jgi:hypothetical protein
MRKERKHYYTVLWHTFVWHVLFLNINLTQKENEAVKKQLRSLSFCVHAIQAVQRKKRKSCLKMNFGNSIVLLMSSTSVKSSKERKITLVL